MSDCDKSPSSVLPQIENSRSIEVIRVIRETCPPISLKSLNGPACRHRKERPLLSIDRHKANCRGVQRKAVLNSSTRRQRPDQYGSQFDLFTSRSLPRARHKNISCTAPNAPDNVSSLPIPDHIYQKTQPPIRGYHDRCIQHLIILESFELLDRHGAQRALDYLTGRAQSPIRSNNQKLDLVKESFQGVNGQDDHKMPPSHAMPGRNCDRSGSTQLRR